MTKLFLIAMALLISNNAMATDTDDVLLEELKSSDFQVSMRAQNNESSTAAHDLLATKYQKNTKTKNQRSDGMIVALRPSYR